MEANRSTAHPNTPKRLRRRAGALAAVVAASGLGVLVPQGAANAVNLPLRPVLVSRDAAGVPADGSANFAELNGNGRYVVFVTAAPMVPDDTNDKDDVYRKDRWSGSVVRVSVSNTEAQSNGKSGFPTISDDGNRVAFLSDASNLAGSDALDNNDVFVRDLKAGTTVKASVSSTGTELPTFTARPVISGNGRFVAYDSPAATVVAGDSNGKYDVFVRDLQTNTNERVSVTSAEAQAADGSGSPSISDDGRYVAFTSDEELAGGQATGTDVYVRDRTAGTTVNADVSSSEVVADGNAGPPYLSGNGRYVVFGSAATNFGGDTNAVDDVYRRDLVAGVTIRVSLHDNDTQLAKDSYPRAISDDGSQVMFDTDAPATAGDAGIDRDVYVRSVGSSSTRRATTSPTAPDVANLNTGNSLSDDGTIMAFSSYAHFVADHPASEQVYVDESMQIGPLPTLAAFITQQFVDFVGRKPTAGELSGWTLRLQNGEATPSSMIASLASTDGFSKYRAPVVRLYWAFFLRKPDPSGLTYWINRYKSGTGLPTIAQKFAQSSEFKSRYGSLTNEQFVKLIYPNIFERQPDPSGLAYWTGKLDAKTKTRGDVIVGFSESSEGKRRLAPQVYITLISQGMLGASPSPAYWDAAFQAYENGETELAWLAQTTLTSVAYDARL